MWRLRNDRGPGPGKTPVVLAQSSPGPGFFAEKTGVLTGVLTTGVPGFPRGYRGFPRYPGNELGHPVPGPAV